MSKNKKNNEKGFAMILALVLLLSNDINGNNLSC